MPILTAKTAYLASIRNGQKTATIRPTCKVQPGEMLTFTDYRTSVRTRCTSVDQVKVSDLTQRHAHADGFADLPALLDALRSHYPDLASSARVWVIRFALSDAAAMPLFSHSGRSDRS